MASWCSSAPSRLTAVDTEALARHMIRDEAIAAGLATLREYDTAYAAQGVGRFRVNI